MYSTGVMALLMSCILNILSIIFFSIFIYKDCKLRNKNSLLWILLLIFISPTIVIIVYLIVRDNSNIICPNCNTVLYNKAETCEKCETVIEYNNKEIRKNNRKYLIFGFSCLILSIISMFLMINAILHL